MLFVEKIQISIETRQNQKWKIPHTFREIILGSFRVKSSRPFNPASQKWLKRGV